MFKITPKTLRVQKEYMADSGETACVRGQKGCGNPTLHSVLLCTYNCFKKLVCSCFFKKGYTYILSQ